MRQERKNEKKKQERKFNILALGIECKHIFHVWYLFGTEPVGRILFGSELGGRILFGSEPGGRILHNTHKKS